MLKRSAEEMYDASAAVLTKGLLNFKPARWRIVPGNFMTRKQTDLVVTNKGNHLLITLCLVCSTIMVKFYEKLWLLKKIANYWHLNFLLLIAPKRGWHLCVMA
jgi:hypothetical protein